MERVRALRDHFVGFVLEMVEDFPAEHRLDGHARFSTTTACRSATTRP